MQPLLKQAAKALDEPIRIPNLTRQILFGSAGGLASGALIAGCLAVGSILTVVTGGIAGLALIVGKYRKLLINCE
jgi:hypothetical protein